MSNRKAEELEKKQEAPQEQLALDDARRVKVLSPGMLVFKRFIRNKLAVIGICILVVMFLFSFLGPVFSSYAISETSYKEAEEKVKYATGKFNSDPRLIGDTSTSLQSGILLALSTTKKGGTNAAYVLTEGMEIPFSTANGDQQYTLEVLHASPTTPTCAVYGNKHVATVVKTDLNYYDPSEVDQGMLDAIMEHATSGSRETEFEYNGIKITVEGTKVEHKYFIPSDEPVALSTYHIYTPVNGKVVDLQSNTGFLLEISKAVMDGHSGVSYEGKNYRVTGDVQNGFIVTGPDNVGLFSVVRGYRGSMVATEEKDSEGKPVQKNFMDIVNNLDEFKDALNKAIAEKMSSFTYDGETYTLQRGGENQKDDKKGSETVRSTEIFVIDAANNHVMTVANSFVPLETRYDNVSKDLYFCFALEKAISEGQSNFQYNNETFGLSQEEGSTDYVVRSAKGDQILLLTDIAYGADYAGVDLTVDFIRNLSDAMRNKKDKFSFVDQYGEQVEGTINVTNANYYVFTKQSVTLVDQRAEPSSDHLLGTDNFGMDVLTRLMYGGRVSLLVGFVVVFFEIILGVILGGVSGYFGGVTDTILMRFVELFNAIPFYPTLIIIGSVMDNENVEPTPRLMLTMALMGILGWTSIARIVRGQILSLREQDFMIAAEATGIRTSRRIFRHLVPNVMPLLIVNATSGLGSVILQEATLGFLGLGVKYPMASWGSIVNQANDMYIMENAWWIWIPSGLFIMITVLGFNFVGDGLRDAFDPKMKR